MHEMPKSMLKMTFVEKRNQVSLSANLDIVREAQYPILENTVRSLKRDQSTFESPSDRTVHKALVPDMRRLAFLD